MIGRLSRAQNGTSMIEFAMLAPVLLLLLVGLIEVGRYMFFGILAAHAARAGVQYGARNLSTAADAAVNGSATTGAALQDGQSLPEFKATSSVFCTVNGALSTCPSNTANAVPPSLVYYVDVQVTGTFKSLMKYPGIPQSLPVSATAIMPVANQ